MPFFEKNALEERMIAHEVISRDFTSRLEHQEAAYWSEYYRDVPPEIANPLGIGLANVGSASAVTASKIDILAFNRVIGLGMENGAAESQIDEIIAFYKDAGAHRFFVQLSPYSEPEDLTEILQAKGFQYHNNWVKFFREIEPLPLVDSKLRIEQIGAERAEVFTEIIVSAFEWPEEVKPVMALPVGRPGWKHYLVYDGDRPAACGALFIRGEFATLAFAATLPEYRGLGAQSALIARRFRDAAEAGCRWMLTETAEETAQRPAASFRNMRRHGFEVAYTRPNYLFENNPSLWR
jgi:ribosomal protein S18 acetylase RimI-like enzyme